MRVLEPALYPTVDCLQIVVAFWGHKPVFICPREAQYRVVTATLVKSAMSASHVYDETAFEQCDDMADVPLPTAPDFLGLDIVSICAEGHEISKGYGVLLYLEARLPLPKSARCASRHARRA